MRFEGNSNGPTSCNWVSGEDKVSGTEEMFEEILTENFQNWWKLAKRTTKSSEFFKMIKIDEYLARLIYGVE